MSERHPLTPLRRWLIDAGSPSKLAALLLTALLMIAVSMAMLNDTADNGPSGLIEIESTGR